MQNQIFRPGGLDLTDIGAKKAHLNGQTPVLDIGCGTGYALKYLCDTYACPVSGIDLAASCVSEAERLLPNAEIFRADACDLPFVSETFHAVFMECTLTLFSDPLLALKEAFRVLSPGGMLIVSTLSRESGGSFVEHGAVCLNQLISALEYIGFSDIDCTDHTDLLIQYIVDIIFQYGSLDAYLKQASDTLGGTVLNCEISPKNTRYHMLTAAKTL